MSDEIRQYPYDGYQMLVTCALYCKQISGGGGSIGEPSTFCEVHCPQSAHLDILLYFL